MRSLRKRFAEGDCVQDIDPGVGPIVEVDDLCVSIRSSDGLVRVVDRLSYIVHPAEALAIVGESGAGKSIAIRAVLGLLPAHKFEVSGSIRIDGRQVGQLSDRARRQYTSSVASLVFQDPTRSLNPTMRVGWQVAEAMQHSKNRNRVRRAEARARALDLMNDVGIADPVQRFESYPHELSGGMRQRIVFAIALSTQPKIIFADEPTTSLDVTTQAQIMDLLEELRATRGLAVVLVSHDLSLAISRTDRLMVMYAGRMVEQLQVGAIGQIAMPYSRALLAAAPEMASAGNLPRAIPGSPPDFRSLPTGCAFHPRCDLSSPRCAAEVPTLDLIEADHLCACWHVPEARAKTMLPQINFGVAGK